MQSSASHSNSSILCTCPVIGLIEKTRYYSYIDHSHQVFYFNSNLKFAFFSLTNFPLPPSIYPIDIVRCPWCHSDTQWFYFIIFGILLLVGMKVMTTVDNIVIRLDNPITKKVEDYLYCGHTIKIEKQCQTAEFNKQVRQT